MRQFLRRFQKYLTTLVRAIAPWLLGKRRSRPQYRRQTSIDWVIPGKLAVGGLPQSEDIVTLSRANIKVVLSLCAEIEGSLPEVVRRDFNCLRLILPDRYYTTEIEISQLDQAVGIVHQSLQNQLPIYVHCLAGIERSPTVCIAYLCRYQNLELWEALNWVKQAHPSTMPNESQLRVLREFSQIQNTPRQVS